VRPADDRGRVVQLALLYLAALVVTGAVQHAWSAAGLVTALFIFIYRPLYLILLSIFREEPREYVTLCVALAVASLVLLLPLTPTRRLAAASLSMVTLVAPTLFGRRSLFALSFNALRNRLAADAPLAANHILSGFFIQGSLFFYAYWADGADYALATQFAYLLNGVLVVQSLVYRIAIHRFAGDLPYASRRKLFGRLTMTSVGIGVASTAALTGFGGPIEAALFGRTGATSTMLTTLAAVVLVHAWNYPLSGLLVGSGQVTRQLAAGILSAVVLVSAMAILTALAVTQVYGVALLAATTTGVVARLVLANPILRRPSR
jgi:hypothetical protein